MSTVAIKDFYVDMNVKNNGVEFDISDAGHLGDLIVNKVGIIWCEGRTRRARGRKISWQELRDYCRNNP